jgi:predicted HTH transcriptional regulator
MESPQKLLPDSGIKDGIKLSKNQEEILRLVQEDKNITQEALAGKIGISTRNVEKRITDLKEKGILKRIGSRKSGYWKIDIELLKNIPADGLKDGKKDGLKDGIKLSKNQEEILRLVQENKNITQEALAEKVGISIRNVEKRITDLKEKGILKRIGSRKSGCWEIDMESLKNITADGLKDGIKDGKKDGIKKK